MKIKKETKLQVGGTPADITARILQDVTRFQNGETVTESRVTFENWRALFSVLTPKRFELLQHVHNHEEPNVRALARSLHRDYKRVYEDVHALAKLGLLDLNEEGPRVDYDRIETAIPL